MIWLLIGLFVFLGIHSVRMIAPDWREAKISTIGLGKWMCVYSLVSTASIVLIIWGYGKAWENNSVLYAPPDWGRHSAWMLMAMAFVLMTFNMRSSRLAPLIKHPFLLSVILWSVAHLLANGDVASVVLFGSFLVWALINRISVSKRGGTLPPVAPLFHDIAAVAVGLIIWALFIWKVHEWLFGVSPIA